MCGSIASACVEMQPSLLENLAFGMGANDWNKGVAMLELLGWVMTKRLVSDKRDGCLIDWFTGQQLFLTGLEA